MPDLPQKIGPYRVLQRLGVGGMGEVLLAHDERLDRRVAIKRIRPEAGTSGERRERFRREARVAARLNHPAIVQVYDILEAGHAGDAEQIEHIVMEYVEGTTLRTLIQRGPLEPLFALRLAREIADGLDAAHHEGIVHRDLKSDNVLVTRSGHAKISDFGIAKQLLAGAEPGLTRANVVLGTYRAMSPEQARGEAVDHRSDLFSFGVLLYEMLTGRNPFEAENELATVNRILSHPHTPVRRLNPEIPEVAEILVDQLLQKDPFLRPRSAGQIARELDAILAPSTSSGEAPTIAEPSMAATSPTSPAFPSTLSSPLQRSNPAPSRPDSALTTLKARPRRLLAAMALLALFGVIATGVWFAWRRPGPPVYVAVLAPEVGVGASGEVELLASGVRSWLLEGLTSLERISPKSFEEVDAVSDAGVHEVRRPSEIARELSADELVSSRLSCQPQTCRITVSRLLGTDGSVLWTDSFEVPTDDIAVVASAVTRQIRQGYADFRTRRGLSDATVAGRDLEELLAIRRALEGREGASFDDLLARLEALHRRAPGFVEVYLLEAEVARRRFYESRNPADLSLGSERVREARALAPGDPEPLFLQIDLALAKQDVDEAEEALETLEGLVPSDVRLLDRRSRILSARGRPEEALELTRTAARRQPSANRLAYLAQLEIQQGYIEEARETLALLLRRSPENFDGLSLLGALELSSGDLNRAVEIYSDLSRRSPGVVHLGNLALAYFCLGRYPEAAETYQRVLAEQPRHPMVTLNLADTYLLMQRPGEAEALYRQVLELIEGDPAAASPQSLTVKAQALAHLGRGREAVAAVQEALRLAPNDGPVAYEAALVYSLLGEDDSALANAERALALGYEERWFSLPWFDGLRRHPEFQRILGAARPAD
jgi:serine/threonine protein kinase/tetratricopeptide (TPR) repeat protein/TolB-like protein